MFTASEYTVTRLCELQPAGKMSHTEEAQPKVAVIRNPHGAGEWTGSFGDGDMAWQVTYSLTLTVTLNPNRHDRSSTTAPTPV